MPRLWHAATMSRRTSLQDESWLATRARSFRVAFRGVLLLSRETHFRVQWVSAILAIGLGGFVGLSLVEWCVLVLAVGLVWVAEGMNTALEHLADAVTREHHPLIGSAKDIAAAAVLIASGASVVVGALLFLPKVLR